MSYSNKHKPPSSANWLASKFIDDRLLEEFYGDLEEIYEDRIESKGKFSAKLMYWVDVLHLLIGFSSIRLFRNNPAILYRHYLLASSRNLLRNKVYSAINILGLAVGMGVCLLIYQYVHFELSFDKFHPNTENIYRVTQTCLRNGNFVAKGVDVTYGLGISAKEHIPEVENVVRISPTQYGLVVKNPERSVPFQEDRIWYADNSFLIMFDFPMLNGDNVTALDQKHKIIVAEDIAFKYFGHTDVLGEELQIYGGWTSGRYTITGVVEKLPSNSQFQFDFLLSMNLLLENNPDFKNSNGWDWENFNTYISLHKSSNLNDVAKKFDQVIVDNMSYKLQPTNTQLKTGFQPIADVHLKSDLTGDLIINNNRDIQNIRFFSIIAVFILIIAWINYINLSTSRAINRAKEVGVRKSIGAFRGQLISQFLFESALVNCLAAILSISFAITLLPVLNNILGLELKLTLFSNPFFWFIFPSIIVSGVLVSGLYPAFFLSTLKQIGAFNSMKTSTEKAFSLRKGLITFQFLTSLLLIAGSYLVYQQVSFMKNQDLGIDMEKILVVDGPRAVVDLEKPKMISSYKLFKNKVVQNHTVQSVSGSGEIPSGEFNFSGNFRKLADKENAINFGHVIFVDTSFTTTYGLKFVTGHSFTKEMSSYKDGVILNETAMHVFGLNSLGDVLNERIIISTGDTLKILGVVKDFHWNSLNKAKTPHLFALNNMYNAYFSFKVSLADIPATIKHIESTYHSTFPNDPFNYYFLDDKFNRQYQADRQFGNLFLSFSILSIFISCLGLFALVSFSASQRVKEIGIRKVLGASMSNLMLLLSKEYFSLLLIASILSIPLIYYLGNFWLENYAFRIEMALEFFLVPALMLVVIALLTVSYRTYKTAKANPVESLRNE